MKKRLTANSLKIIAIITMIIDHIGYYLYPLLDADVYYIFRNIGRISMPIFTYLIVEGFFHTKNLKKYIIRLLGFAIITQISLLVLRYFNINYFVNYSTSSGIYLNILFSYVLSLIILACLDKKKNLSIQITIISLIMLFYMCINIDYGMRIPFIMIALYFIKKFCSKYQIPLIAIVFTLSLLFVQNGPVCKYSMLLALPFIACYNGEKGKNSKLLKYIFYTFFPVHHIILYMLAMFFAV